MILSRLVEILGDLDQKCKKHQDAPRLNIKTIRIECENDIIITISDKKPNKDNGEKEEIEE